MNSPQTKIKSKLKDVSKIIFAFVLAIGIVFFYAFVIYYLVTIIWPILPGWGKSIGYVIIAILVISSPIMCYLPKARRQLAEKRKQRKLEKEKEKKADNDM